VDDPPVPFHWLAITSSPPQQRRDEVREICQRHGGRLCENQIYYDEQGVAHALVEVPADDGKQRDLLDALGAQEWLGLVHADEKHDGKRPPKSGRRGQT
jgi:hypothetical protein